MLPVALERMWELAERLERRGLKVSAFALGDAAFRSVEEYARVMCRTGTVQVGDTNGMTVAITGGIARVFCDPMASSESVRVLLMGAHSVESARKALDNLDWV